MSMRIGKKVPEILAKKVQTEKIQVTVQLSNSKSLVIQETKKQTAKK